MTAHDAIGYGIQLAIGLLLVWVGHKLNVIHVLVNSNMTAARAEIVDLKKALGIANAVKGKHDEGA